MATKENEPRTATRSGITSHNTFDRGEGRDRSLLCTALRFNGAQITAHRLLQVVKAGHFKSFSKVSALGYPVFLTVSPYPTIYSCAITYLVQNVAHASYDSVNIHSTDRIRDLSNVRFVFLRDRKTAFLRRIKRHSPDIPRSNLPSEEAINAIA